MASMGQLTTITRFKIPNGYHNILGDVKRSNTKINNGNRRKGLDDIKGFKSLQIMPNSWSKTKFEST
jgi:hypothetical protein